MENSEKLVVSEKNGNRNNEDMKCAYEMVVCGLGGGCEWWAQVVKWFVQVYRAEPGNNFLTYAVDISCLFPNIVIGSG